MPKKHLVLLILSIVSAIFIAGCGGGGGSSPDSEYFGSATLTILWTAAIDRAPDIQSVRITIDNGSTTVTERVVNRPAGDSSSTVSFEPLPTGVFAVSVAGYTQSDAAGSPAVESCTPMAIQAAADTKLSFATEGTVDQIEVTGAPTTISVGDTVSLTATPIDTNGTIILLVPGCLGWQVQNPSIASISSDGVVTGMSAGTTNITATDTGSGLSGSIGITVRGAKWTVMVYMAADNNLEPYAIQDINELEAVGSTKDVSVVVQIDRSPAYDTSNGNWTETRRYLIKRDADRMTIGSQLLANMGEQDMASSQTLRDFVQWASSAYQADKYLLVLWDHGRGWRSRTLTAGMPREIRAICVDDSSNNEMSLPDLTSALISSPRTNIVLFDACLMGMIEVAHAIKDCTDVMVASEENVPVQGQPYDRLLGALVADPNMSPEEVGRTAVDEYIDHYSDGYSGTFTLSALDLHAMDDLVSATDLFADAVLANMGSVKASVETAQAYTQRFDYDANEYRYYKDLYDFASRVYNGTSNPLVKTAAQNILSAVNSTIIHERHLGSAMSGAHGISIYLPDPGSWISQYASTSFSTATKWDEMVVAY